jgi:hypothetical protein
VGIQQYTCSPGGPEGRADCSHGWSEVSPTGDPERNPWEENIPIPAPAGAAEAFWRLVP